MSNRSATNIRAAYEIMGNYGVFKIIDSCRTCCKYKNSLRACLLDALIPLSDDERHHVATWLEPRISTITDVLYCCETPDSTKEDALHWFCKIVSGSNL